MTNIEAMKQALEVLERYAPQHGHPDDMSDAITALRTDIEAAEKQEPVADGLIRGYINALVANNHDEAADATKRMVDYVFATPPAAPVQEPVAWMKEGWGPDCGPYIEFYRDDEMGWRDRKEWTPLYTTQPAAPVQPEQEPVAVPSFIRQRLEREIETATNPKGMSVHDGRTRALATDIAYLLKVIDTTPPAAQRQPLTKERIGQIIEQCKITLVNYCSDEKQTEFARAIEAAHGIQEKNT